ncbi:MAG TPA: selenocysteine-specific translation elongation factor [Candidatus Latescibacteria bacterium]|jgi:selenocysteine-specific elongation factor|nr:selenocysteine-specific translation elongation factor [Gemmatimonadaceae bacterium]HJP33023.1 selenocysteine-specific translation elongation factor [Candidatus Latescibacterota bacterium]
MSSPHVILGTAGHVDHGKTALVKALTGIDTDTQPEEQARGVTIDVGFAYWKDHVTFIDVPGHERFIKNAVTGASSIDLALFVVAADDGVMPQTREHLAILQLLGIQHGVVALTKTDLVEPDWVELVTEELSELFADTFLSGAPILPVSSTTGDGVDDLRSTLEDEIGRVAVRADRGAFRLPVDRVFSVAGFGTVVTGTVLAGIVRPRDELVLQPRGQSVRVRGVQVHGQDRPEAGVGLRAAVNLSDLDAADVERGDTLALPGFFPSTYMLDASLSMLADIPAPLLHRDRVRLHLGPSEVLARVVLLDADVLGPDDNGYVQLRLESPAVAAHGDRFVIRRYSPAQTLGGGIILDPLPPKHRRRRPEVLSTLGDLDTDTAQIPLEVFLRSAGDEGRTAPELAHLLGEDVESVVRGLLRLVEAGQAASFADGGTSRFLHDRAWSRLCDATLQALATFHRTEPLKSGIGREPLRQQVAPRCPQPVYDAALEHLAETGRLRTQASLISLAEHEVELSAELESLRQSVGELLREGGAAPPDEEDLPDKVQAGPADVQAVIEVMQGRGELVRLADQLLFDAGVLQDLEKDLVSYLQDHGEIEVSTFRELAATTRKYAVPLLNHFDSRGVTQRDGSVRRLITVTE